MCVEDSATMEHSTDESSFSGSHSILEILEKIPFLSGTFWLEPDE
jgi:hypothetical protein